MTEHVKQFLALMKSRAYRDRRVDNVGYDVTELVNQTHCMLREATILEDTLTKETPNLPEGDIFGFNRTLIHLPYYTKENGKTACLLGQNVTPNYARAIGMGFDALLREIDGYAEVCDDEEKRLFYEGMRRQVLATLRIADRYREAAEAEGNTRLAAALSRVPRLPAESFYEACVFFKFLIYTLRLARHGQMTLGRFDQYMYPYYERDLALGVSREELFETLELLFISLNLDADIYTGLQTGDNGQSMVLGGFDKNGKDQFNDLSRLCIDASLELTLIDPKINLRVSKKTPDWIYELGTKLTKQGLGFPQYCNDDVIVPYMISLGYDEEDACNYTVAACWEVISPNNGADVPNATTFSFPMAVHLALHSCLLSAKSFEELMAAVKEEIRKECERIRATVVHRPSPKASYLSLFVDGCLEKGKDCFCGGAKYHNLGSHGAGISTAADSLAAVKRLVFEEKRVSAEELLRALEANFEGYEALRGSLAACPKMGNNDDFVDTIAHELMTAFEDHLHGKPTLTDDGIWRAGTGSALEYIRTARKCPATPDGRYAYAPFACSFSPAIGARLNGPLSVLQSFTKHDLGRISNGGPLTMELHDTVFRNEEGEKKVAQLVKTFIHMGGHQLQLNAINRDRLLDAKAHPEEYPNLIVRVWGWSGYFSELDPVYQDHIISRTAYTV